MADTAVAITAGAGTNIDTRTEATNGNHRQVIVVGDPATNAGVAPVSATQGLGVNIISGGVASGAIASGAIASGAVASGAVASGAFASGALASGSIAAGAIAAGATSIAENEDVGSADGDRGVKILVTRKATPANVSGTDGDYEFPQMSAGSIWVASEATDKTLDSERVINGGAEYETVAASQTAQALGATGATGDYLAGILVTPATTSPGVVTILDNAISINVFAGGASSVSNLVPFFIPLGIKSVSGAWKITTGANVSAIGIGKFTA
jgi:hypothetical protein